MAEEIQKKKSFTLYFIMGVVIISLLIIIGVLIASVYIPSYIMLGILGIIGIAVVYILISNSLRKKYHDMYKVVEAIVKHEYNKTGMLLNRGIINGKRNWVVKRLGDDSLVYFKQEGLTYSYNPLFGVYACEYGNLLDISSEIFRNDLLKRFIEKRKIDVLDKKAGEEIESVVG